MSTANEIVAELLANIRRLARDLFDAIKTLIKPYLDAFNRWMVRRRHSKRRKAAHKLAQARRKVAPVQFVPVRRRDPSALKRQRR